MKQDWDEEGGEREREKEREKMVPMRPCMVHVHPGYPEKEISTILVFNILLQVDLFPMEVGALSPFCCVSTEPG